MSDAHIYFFYGNDEFAIRKRVEKFGAMFTDPTSADMNTARLDARTVTENQLVNAVSSMPFLAPKRLVILENVSKGYPGADGHKKLIAFLETVPPSTLLVMIDFEEIKEREILQHWLVKWTAKAGERAKSDGFHMPRQREMPGWIVAEAKRQGGSIEPAAAARLAEMTGEDTRQAAQEITKLLTYVNWAHAIGIEDVEAVSIVTAGVDIFEFVDALASQSGKQAQRMLHRMFENQDAFEIFPMVIRQFRLLLLARDVMDDGGTLQDAAQTLGAHPYVAEKAWNQARKFSADALNAIYHRLLLMDEAAKTGVMPLDTALDAFVVELTGKR